MKRLRCCRCGKKATQAWQVCADKNRLRAVCDECDVKLNNMVLKFMGFQNRKRKMKRYRKRLEEK